MTNAFDQLCINYTNERVQQLFVDMMLLKEKKWYDFQELQINFVPFFNNIHIIGAKHFLYINQTSTPGSQIPVCTKMRLLLVY